MSTVLNAARPLGLARLEELDRRLDGALRLGLGLAWLSCLGAAASPSAACLPSSALAASDLAALALVVFLAGAWASTMEAHMIPRAAAANAARASRATPNHVAFPGPVEREYSRQVGGRSVRRRHRWRRLYSTVTLLARLRGWSTSVPWRTAVW